MKNPISRIRRGRVSLLYNETSPFGNRTLRSRTLVLPFPRWNRRRVFRNPDDCDRVQWRDQRSFPLSVSCSFLCPVHSNDSPSVSLPESRTVVWVLPVPDHRSWPQDTYPLPIFRNEVSSLFMSSRSRKTPVTREVSFLLKQEIFPNEPTHIECPPHFRPWDICLGGRQWSPIKTRSVVVHGPSVTGTTLRVSRFVVTLTIEGSLSRKNKIKKGKGRVRCDHEVVRVGSLDRK